MGSIPIHMGRFMLMVVAGQQALTLQFLENMYTLQQRQQQAKPEFIILIIITKIRNAVFDAVAEIRQKT